MRVAMKRGRFRKRFPEGLTEVMNVEGIGPKKAMKLHEELGVGSLDDLKQAAQDGRIKDLDGFGEKTQEKILRSIETLAKAFARTFPPPWQLEGPAGCPKEAVICIGAVHFGVIGAYNAPDGRPT